MNRLGSMLARNLATSSVAVLGCGIVGSNMAKDMSKKYDVTSYDVNSKNLNLLSSEYPSISTKLFDLSDFDALREEVKDYDLVIGAGPSAIGYDLCKTVCEAGVDIVDISFFAEDPFSLDDVAKENGVTCVTDCGIAPGLGNIYLGYFDTIMDVEYYCCYCGGLPMERKMPYQYTCSFAPLDVIELYTRPAIFIENGQVVTKDLFSGYEYVDFDGIGSLQAFNTDGLRTLIETLPHIPTMKEKTMRFPGTLEYCEVLYESGFFSYDEVELPDGTKIRPIDVTSALLFPVWTLEEGQENFSATKLIIEGAEGGVRKSYTYVNVDISTESTMSRVTGYTATSVANLMLDGKVEKGFVPPELVGAGNDGENFKFITEYMAERGVVFDLEVKEL